MPRLIVLPPRGHAKQFNITESATTLGRAPSNRICIDSERASWHHATIQREAGGFVLTDMESRNGTYINNARVANCPLRNGDAITIGDCHIRFLDGRELLLPGEALRQLTTPADLDVALTNWGVIDAPAHRPAAY